MPTASRRASHARSGANLTADSLAALAFVPTWPSGRSARGGRHRHTSVLSLAAAIVLGAVVGVVSGLLLLAAFFTTYLSI